MDRRARDAIGIPRARKKDMETALLTARHPKDSKFGECLINLNTKKDPLLNSQLTKLKSEMRRMKLQANQVKDYFVRRSQVLNYEPMILVERPPSSKFKPQIVGMTSEEIEDLEKPGYMRRLRTRCKTPVQISKIEAFTRRTSKKRNVWEKFEDDKSYFTSTVRPYSRLNNTERTELKYGWNHHKPQYSQESNGKQLVSKND
ncbi:hypothetical protein LOTGIDRAFT_154771 [Lottia gigantea]|uniref:Uncharacterized protein n=1 Tax=Lottia gigantea TaxID=225164 RepID=V4A1U2_LOTGI|nr:hypothetical protein LOTGIDRAFT_154771 [Lottia gigantea]ESO87271.1 hypothetical protein LOTGIDRAFT_154771 [Lottia gigantea]